MPGKPLATGRRSPTPPPVPGPLPVLAVVLALAAAGCGEGDPGPGEGSAPRASGTPGEPVRCEAAGASRWAPAGGVGYRRTAVYGDDEAEWIGALAGGGYARGRVYLFDGAGPDVRVLGPGLEEERRFGREGDGPGELATDRWRPWTRENGLWADSGGILVMDGERVQSFSPDGRFQERWVPALGLAVTRVWRRDGDVRVARNERAFMRRRTRGTGEEGAGVVVSREHGELAAVGLPRPPTINGVPFSPAEEARAVAVPGRGCELLSDGHGSWLLRIAPDGSAVDTLHLELPERFAEPMNPEEARGLMRVSPGDPVPEAEARQRIRGLAVDPDGWVWIFTYPTPELERADLDEIHLVNPATGAVEPDTLAAFPWFFGEPGVFYTVVRDSLGLRRVERWEAGNGG